jgi:hypothetical protein
MTGDSGPAFSPLGSVSNSLHKCSRGAAELEKVQSNLRTYKLIAVWLPEFDVHRPVADLVRIEPIPVDVQGCKSHLRVHRAEGVESGG